MDGDNKKVSPHAFQFNHKTYSGWLVVGMIIIPAFV